MFFPPSLTTLSFSWGGGNTGETATPQKKWKTTTWSNGKVLSQWSVLDLRHWQWRQGLTECKFMVLMDICSHSCLWALFKSSKKRCGGAGGQDFWNVVHWKVLGLLRFCTNDVYNSINLYPCHRETFLDCQNRKNAENEKCFLQGHTAYFRQTQGSIVLEGWVPLSN